MRTTVSIAEDVSAEIERMRRKDGLGLSEALNLLARRGIAASSSAAAPYTHSSRPMTARIDISNTAEVLDLLDSLPDPE